MYLEQARLLAQLVAIQCPEEQVLFAIGHDGIVITGVEGSAKNSITVRLKQSTRMAQEKTLTAR